MCILCQSNILNLTNWTVLFLIVCRVKNCWYLKNGSPEFARDACCSFYSCELARKWPKKSINFVQCGAQRLYSPWATITRKMPNAVVQREIPADQHDGAVEQRRFMRMSKKRRYLRRVLLGWCPARAKHPKGKGREKALKFSGAYLQKISILLWCFRNLFSHERLIWESNRCCSV